MSFDQLIDRSGTGCKWQSMERTYGVPAEGGIAMSVADSDYPCAPVILDAVQGMVARGGFGYGYDRVAYRDAVAWWMTTRHGWSVDPDWVLTAQGLGLAIALCLDVFSAPGEGVAFFTPVYHEFRLKTERAHRRPVELPLALEDGRYVIDWDAAEARITPDTRVLLFCAPQNPSGRVWSAEEMRAVADFAARHDLILVSDEVHADLVYPDAGARHVPMAVAAPEHADRTVTLFAASKTFNLAGLRVGQLIVPDPALRARLAERLTALNYDPATLGVVATTAAYSPAGAAWADAQLAYLQGNRDLFDAAIATIPGVASMKLQATFLAWVDFSGTGMSRAEIEARLFREARIAVQPGGDFCAETALWNRFNFAMPRALVAEAAARLQAAFADLQ